MATINQEATWWQVISLNSRKAAQHLLDVECYRSSVSRSYYSAYAAVTGQLIARGLLFAHERPNPSHADLPGYILNNLGSLPQTTRFDLNKAMRRLYAARIDADYVAGATVGRATASNSLRDLNRALLALGLENFGAQGTST